MVTFNPTTLRSQFVEYLTMVKLSGFAELSGGRFPGMYNVGTANFSSLLRISFANMHFSKCLAQTRPSYVSICCNKSLRSAFSNHMLQLQCHEQRTTFKLPDSVTLFRTRNMPAFRLSPILPHRIFWEPEKT